MYVTPNPTLRERKNISSFSHKLKRIRYQELFKTAHYNSFEKLTKRERQILQLIARDCNNPDIAKKLYISRATVEQHRKNINRKLNTRSFGQLFQYALAFDLI